MADRQWWRRLMNSSGKHMDNAQPMRMAGRFSGRVRGYARSTEFQSSTADVERQTRPRRRLLATHTVRRRLLLVLVGRAEVRSWDAPDARSGSILFAAPQDWTEKALTG